MISDLRLQQFRSYADETFEFGQGVNIIVGPNASGKTNLLEAVLVICKGASYRARDNELIAFEAPLLRLEAHTDNEQRTVAIEHAGNVSHKTFHINTVPYKRLPRNKYLPVVLFEPEHLQLLSGGPERRREFLDNLLDQTQTGYGKLLRDYRRTLAQRNALLKTGNERSELFAWNIRLCELGEQIVKARLSLIDTIQEELAAVYQSISSTEQDISITYHPSVDPTNYSTHLLHKLEANEALDFQRGFTAYGPHREDFTIAISDHEAKQAASRGEARTLLLALKVLELELVERTTGKRPLLLLDDVFSELDGARRQALTAFLKKYQTFITTTDADVVVQHFMDDCTIIPTSR